MKKKPELIKMLDSYRRAYTRGKMYDPGTMIGGEQHKIVNERRKGLLAHLRIFYGVGETAAGQAIAGVDKKGNAAILKALGIEVKK